LARMGIDGPILIISVCTASAAALTTALATTYQAQRSFVTYSIILTACPSFGLLLTTLLATLQVREPAWYLIAIFASYTPTAWLAHLRLRNLGSEHRQVSSLLHDALHFGGWVTVGSLAYVLFQRIDVFILAGLDPGPDVGTYGAAARFATIAAVFGSTITTVLMPTG